MLRKARNQRYQAKLKSKGGRTAAKAAAVADDSETDRTENVLRSAMDAEPEPEAEPAAAATPPPPVLRHRPIAIPVTPDVFLINAIKCLNAQLVEWGYSDQDRNTLYQRLQDEAYEELRQVQDRVEWMRAKEAWVAEGDAILENIQVCLRSEIKDHCDGDVDLLADYWRQLSRVAYRVQYMMAAAEFHIDTVYF
ncbi:hypothetical protein K466DRAFT_604428 [Polyporus arcularius HHB13444]|uniref:Uncharacterized protein n=1 Tax=Polyporus arcularius HHB13444 TaxID=1314778 RepID=A0A5C3NYU6_9APHY|nr:hypothetical protein K466DRAFT_604428 [Polyporus arcularius HHB13444]